MARKSEKRGRRAFLRTLTAAPLVPALAPAEAQEAAQPQHSAEVDALAETVRIRFGQYLAEGDMPEIKRGIERMLRNADALRKIKIGNGDEPDFMFHPRDSL